MKAVRATANIRHLKCGEALLLPLISFGDHLTSAVLLSVNTGLRRGELLKLRWTSVDFNRRLLTVEGHVNQMDVSNARRTKADGSIGGAPRVP